MRGLLTTLLLLLGSSGAWAQQVGDNNRDYCINARGSGQASLVPTFIGGANSATLLNRYQTLEANAPVLWLESANAAPGQLVIGPNSLDIGSAPGFADLTILGNGLDMGLWNSLFATDGQGEFSFSISLPPITSGYATHLAMAHIASSSPVGWWISQTHRTTFVNATVAVVAQGANSFNSDPSSGFFQVHNLASTDPISCVVLDWAGTTDPAQSTMVFDTDQSGMASRFDGGDSLLGSCAGTYRNGSASTVGLDFTGTDLSPCDPLARVGFVARNGLVPAQTPEVKTLEFNFLPGSFVVNESFEFDVDTDGGMGVSGGDMEGLAVSVQLQSGTLFQGFLIRSVVDPQRSEALFGE